MGKKVSDKISVGIAIAGCIAANPVSFQIASENKHIREVSALIFAAVRAVCSIFIASSLVGETTAFCGPCGWKGCSPPPACVILSVPGAFKVAAFRHFQLSTPQRRGDDKSRFIDIALAVLAGLARATRDLLNTLDAIGARFRSLNDAWADTTTAHGRLLLTFLGGIAEFERDLIRARTGEGRGRVKARGGTWAARPAHPPSTRGSPASPCRRHGDASRFGASLRSFTKHDFEANIETEAMP